MKKYIFIIFIFLSLCIHAGTHKINNKAIEKYKKGLFEEAISDMNKAILQEQDRAILYNNRGFMKAASNDYFGALSDFNKAIELDNDDNAKSLAYFNRGNLKVKSLEYDDAVKDYTNAININDKFAEAFKARALAKQKSAELDLKKFEELSK